MMDGAATWGVPGSVFLVVWIVLAGGAVALPHVLVARAARRADPSPALGSRDDRDLSAEQLAVLTAGPRRAVEVAIARLLENGRLRVSRNRVLTAAADTGPGPGESDLDAAVLHAVGPGTPLHRVVSGVERTRAVTEVSEQLVARGLLVDPDLLRARRRLGRVVLGLVVLLGLVRLAAGVARGAPTVLLIIALLVVVWLGLRFLRVSVHRLTARGTAASGDLVAQLRGLRDTDPGGDDGVVVDRPSGPGPAGRRTTATVLPVALAGAAGLVAVGGLAAFPDPGVGTLLAGPASAGWSSDGGSSFDGGSSCGSSCGGASSCGSSCGGGGGCGG